MKGLLRLGWTAVIVMAMSLGVRAQVVFSEDFDNVGGAIAGGAGTYQFPAGWFLRNVDNLTPAASVSYINEAWERREDFKFGTSDSCAFSTSWYAPVGTANDFMWTPAIGPLPANCQLSWNGVAYDPAYPDGYEVRIMTTQPLGGTADIGNQITNSTVIFSTTGEASAWTNHTVNLAAYQGMTVYIGFRNTSTDMFVLLIDDILVQVNKIYDPAITSFNKLSDYTMVPLQQTTPVNLKALVKNQGAGNLHNVTVKCDVFNSSGTMVYTTTSSILDSLVSNDTVSLVAGNFMPAVADSFTFKMRVMSAEADDDTTNNVVFRNLVFTDTIYAMDKAPYTGMLGIGAGAPGFLGNQFTITDTTELRSVTMSFNRGYNTTKVHAVVFKISVDVPDPIIASTDSVFYNGLLAQDLTIPIAGGPLTLLPGEYVIAAVEVDSILTLRTTTNYFVPLKSWVYWSTIPLGVFDHPENLGFPVSFAIRANLYHCPVLSSAITVTDATCGTCNDGTASVTAGNGTSPYTYAWSNGGNTPAISNLLPGDILVTISDAFRCSVSDTAVIGFSSSIEESIEKLVLAPNPGNGLYYMGLPEVAGANASFKIYTQEGQMVYSMDIPEGSSGTWAIDITHLSPSVYLLVYDNGKKIIVHKIIKQ